MITSPMTLFLADAAATNAPVSGAILGLVFVIILAALVFDFLNGFHDAANSIATIVSTRVLTPGEAVAWAAMFNFVAAFVFGTGVAKTIGSGLVDVQFVDIYVVFAGLVGAIIWNIITWLLGLPTSSSHALVAGVAGAAIAKSGAGFGVLIASGWFPLLAFIVLSPLIGFILGMFNMVVVSWIFRRASPHRVDSVFRRLQLLSAAIYSLGHGGNDAQKTMGIIVMLLTAAGLSSWVNVWDWDLSWIGFSVPAVSMPLTGWSIPSWHLGLPKHAIGWPIILSCNAAIALGTLLGGWRIVKTLGSSITRLQPVGGFCAEAAAATTIIGATIGHIPISTTHAITGAILGVGTTKGIRSVRWIWGQRIVMAWILTIPCAAFMSAVAYMLIHHFVEPWFK